MLPRTIDWVDGRIVVVDQTALPAVRTVELSTVDDVVDAIRRLLVRGAPALGVAGAMGVALAARRSAHRGAADVTAEAERIAVARPTAANLRWGVRQALAALPAGPAAVLTTALRIRDDDIAACHAIGRGGAALLAELCGSGPLRLHTHCNAGALACVEWGTALGVVRSLHEQGRIDYVVVDETRPLLQGARITAVELAELGVSYRIVVDGAGPSIIARGLVDAVVVGADRIAANGDVANKIGTYPLALAAARAGVPFVVAAPESTVDVQTPDGAAIEIEDRVAEEVLSFHGSRTAPRRALGWNPAFDVTPAALVTAIVTESRVITARTPAAGSSSATR